MQRRTDHWDKDNFSSQPHRQHISFRFYFLARIEGSAHCMEAHNSVEARLNICASIYLMGTGLVVSSHDMECPLAQLGQQRAHDGKTSNSQYYCYQRTESTLHIMEVITATHWHRRHITLHKSLYDSTCPHCTPFFPHSVHPLVMKSCNKPVWAMASHTFIFHSLHTKVNSVYQ